MQAAWLSRGKSLFGSLLILTAVTCGLVVRAQRRRGEIRSDPAASATPVAPILAVLHGGFLVTREGESEEIAYATFDGGDRLSIRIDSRRIERRIVDVEPGPKPGTATVLTLQEGLPSLVTVAATESVLLTLEDEDGSISHVTVARLPLGGTVLRVEFDDRTFASPVILRTVWSLPFHHQT